MTLEQGIACDLESNRVQELEDLLPKVQSKIIEFVKSAELDENNELKPTIGPTFNSPEDLKELLKLDRFDYYKGQRGGSQTGLMEMVDSLLQNSVNTWHPGFLDKLYASTNPIGIISDLLLSTLNTNSHVFTVSPALTLIEKFVSHEYAKKFGFTDKESGGLTFNGGSWSNVTSLHIARSILFPQTKLLGNGDRKFAIYTSLHSHYSIEKSCILLGMGSESVFKININSRSEMDVDHLEKTIAKSIEDGFTPLYVNATAGTTVFGSFDPFEDIAKVAKKYNIWFHVDASWGGNVIFSNIHKHKLKGSNLADSITSNPHKMLGVPTTCSFLLLPNKSIFQKSNSLAAPYLFHNNNSETENFDLADGTMGCGRRADSLKFYLSWLYYGESGFAKRIDHAFEIANYFATKISKLPNFELISDLPLPCLQVCFYFKPIENLSKAENTDLTRRIAKKLYQNGKFLIDYSPNPNQLKDKGEFFRVVFNTPSLTSGIVDDLINEIIVIGKDLYK
ncbi:hypothetical protein PACTADRAFT_48832 [Pachysolen tannophilus NRRL Y-2460]|uniref:Aminotransferase class V domain-containing protein n=1 Tax=Pachysolen tannophilus NRRL Y-2460 TaxID=669874 RepID=A0A1E4TZA6_PACTA|nr:hypothetical protein PACTADRAFT_48832 [Pachysolen tannophilus NRRL Y-2460]